MRPPRDPRERRAQADDARDHLRDERRLRDWLEEAIREAEARGAFRDLEGRGRPLDLSENPFEPEPWRLGHRLLRGHGFAPEWIELDREIRSELEAARAILAGALALLERASAAPAGDEPAPPSRGRRGSRWWPFRRRHPKTRENAGGDAPPAAAGFAALAEEAERRFRERAAEINRLIGRYNLIVPISWLQRRKVDVDAELARFREAWRQHLARLRDQPATADAGGDGREPRSPANPATGSRARGTRPRDAD